VSSDQETFRRLAVESRLLEDAANELQSRINLTNAALTELRVSSMTLDGLENEKKDAEIFVPIGGGSYVKARLETAKKVVVGIGADVAVEKTVKETKEAVEARIVELEKTRDALGQQFSQVIERIQNNRASLEEVTAKLREEGEKAGGVRKAKKGA
jgi:prefoldin alpha subunit